MKEPRINLTRLENERIFQRQCIDFYRTRHAEAVAAGQLGHIANGQGPAYYLIGFMMRDGVEVTQARAAQLVEAVAAGVRVALAYDGASDYRYPLIEVGCTVLVFAALGLEVGSLREFVPHMRHMDRKSGWYRHDEWQWGFFSLCIEAAPCWQTAAGLMPGEALPVFAPGQTFEFNMQGLMRYLAAAIEQGASKAAVMPAYRDYLRNFTILKRADEASLQILFCIAVLVHHRIGGHPITAVPALLQQDHLANVEDVPDEAPADAKA